MTEPSRFRLLAVPILITFAVTIFRLVGEFQNWSPRLFSRQPGGLGALVGIIWLAPLFGFYFGRRLLNVGHAPPSTRRALMHALGAVPVLVGWGLLNALLWPPFQAQVLGAAAASLLVVVLQVRGWPELGKLLLWYAIGARVPVVVIMLMAIYGQWGTHYDAFPAGFPLTQPFQIWLWAGLLVQMTFWVGATVLLGAVVGTVAAVASGRKAGVQPEMSPN